MRAEADGRTGGRADGCSFSTEGTASRTPPSGGTTQSAGPPVRRSARLWRRLRRTIESCAAVLRRIAGMPDYQAYLRHLRLNHPDWPVPSEREFFALYVESRYGNGPSRCC
jgi:uncharacterized short protein YbdD (DUF466 family)